MESIHFKSGADSPDAAGGSITFTAGNTQKTVLQFCPNGDFIFQGNRVTTDIDLYNAFREFSDSVWTKRTKVIFEEAGKVLVIEAFRELRTAWFNSQLRSHAHEREGETEERESARERDNERLKAKFDQQTEAIVAGQTAPVCPRCSADMS